MPLQIDRDHLAALILRHVAFYLVLFIIFLWYFFPIILSVDAVSNHTIYRIETSPVDSEILYIGPNEEICNQDPEDRFFLSTVTGYIDLETAQKECPDLVNEQIKNESNYIMQLYVTVFDKYGRHLNGTLVTNSANGSTTDHSLQLINGLPYNGTYLGTIRELNNNSVVEYTILFSDEFGYRSDKISDRIWDPDNSLGSIGGITLKPSTDPDFKSLQMITPAIPQNPVMFRAVVTDSEGDLKNVTLSYGLYDKPMGEVYYAPFPDKEIPMNETIFGSDIYEASVPAHPENTTVIFYADSYDDFGNWESLGLDYAEDGSPVPTSYTVTTPWWIDRPELLNNVNVQSEIVNLNLESRSAEITLPIELKNANRTQISTIPFENYNSTYAVIEGVKSDLDLDMSKVFNFTAPLTQEHPSEIVLGGISGYEMINTINASIADYSNIDQPFKTFVKLSGDPTTYPFDKYSIHLILAVPLENANFNFSNSLSNIVNVNWDDKYSARVLPSDANSVYNSLNCPPYDTLSNQRVMACDTSTTTISSEVLDFPSFLDTSIELERSYTISVVIIPLISIFFLLGAIFIFHNTQDNIGNVLALTLGIFALIFTLPDIINSMKPQTTSPTIADSMLSIIIIATIAFTVGSIISSSPIIHKWFPKHYSWIDVIAFVIISIFVISYFNNYLYDGEMWWLVPLILFGLGYGLLLRAFGIKIDKPLIGVLWSRRKNVNVKKEDA